MACLTKQALQCLWSGTCEGRYGEERISKSDHVAKDWNMDRVDRRMSRPKYLAVIYVVVSMFDRVDDESFHTTSSASDQMHFSIQV